MEGNSMATKLRSTNGTRHDTVAVDTISVTTHVVHVNLADLLGKYDVTDNVVLMVATPSGRDKRVAVNGGFLVPPHHATGWGTCDFCGSTNVEVDDRLRCRSCR
jgi:hypothetical protein